jgi:ribosome-binding factor A
MNIRPMPRILFAPDRGNENAAKVEKLLEEENN